MRWHAGAPDQRAAVTYLLIYLLTYLLTLLLTFLLTLLLTLSLTQVRQIRGLLFDEKLTSVQLNYKWYVVPL